MADFHAQQNSVEAQQRQEKLAVRRDLDQVLADKRVCEERKMSKERAEDEERNIFADAKKVGFHIGKVS